MNTLGTVQPGTPQPVWVATIHRVARGCALAGGLLLCGLAVLVVASVLGRELLQRPIPGDFEIVAFGTAITVFLCLPYCQLRRGNLMVDFFLSGVSRRIHACLDGVAAIVFGMLSCVIGWRMAAGMLDAIAYRDITMILGLSNWWVYPFAVGCFFLLAAACVVTALRDWGNREW
ncbi:MAG: TRAP transporter small permease [Gammaproteobacteria bacterium]|nr:TRAP transporter small permease [Gammaproteobacteria bacterium]